MTNHTHRFICQPIVNGVTPAVCACGEKRQYLDPDAELLPPGQRYRRQGQVKWNNRSVPIGQPGETTRTWA